MKLGSRVLNEEVEEGEFMHVSGTVCVVQEAAFVLQKPSEIFGRETDYVQTVYLQTNEKFWYNWRYRETIESLGEEAWGHLPYGLFHH